MPVYIHTVSLIVSKKSILEKYQGGLEAFKKDFKIDISDLHQEDQDLFCVARMDVDDYDIELLMERGMEFDEPNQFSNDYVYVYRYGGMLWKVDWLIENQIFAWHPSTNSKELAMVEEVCNTNVDDLFIKWEKPFQAIWLDI